MAETFDAVHANESVSIGGLNQRDARVEIKSPLDGRSNRFVADAEGTVRVGGNRSSGVLILFPAESAQPDVSGASVRLSAQDGLLELGSSVGGRTQITIQLRGDEAIIRVGDHGMDGELVLLRSDGTPAVMLNAANGQGVLGSAGSAGSLQIRDGTGSPNIELNGNDGQIQIGGNGTPGGGRLILKDSDGVAKVTLSGLGGRVSAEEARLREIIGIDNGGKGRIGIDGNTATVRIGFAETAGHLILRSEQGETVHLDGELAQLEMGGTGKPGSGRLILKDPDGATKVTLSGHGGQVSAEEARLREIIVIDNGGKGRIGIDGNTATVRIGFDDKSGRLILRSEGGETIRLDGQEGNLWLGGHGADGDLVLFPSDIQDTNDVTKARFHLDGQGGNAWIGGNGVDGDLMLFAKNADLSGITDPAQKIQLATIHLDGDAGDIILQNADCAEEFDVVGADAVEPGTVLVISSEDTLMPSARAYDKRVAGVVSGAGQYRPGIVLDKQHTPNTRLPVALMGKVFCRVDAQYGAIEVGDLLTTSDTPGHAMKATDPFQILGSVLGKALRPLGAGTGLIPVLVTLQ